MSCASAPLLYLSAHNVLLAEGSDEEAMHSPAAADPQGKPLDSPIAEISDSGMIVTLMELIAF